MTKAERINIIVTATFCALARFGRRLTQLDSALEAGKAMAFLSKIERKSVNAWRKAFADQQSIQAVVVWINKHLASTEARFVTADVIETLARLVGRPVPKGALPERDLRVVKPLVKLLKEQALALLEAWIENASAATARAALVAWARVVRLDPDVVGDTWEYTRKIRAYWDGLIEAAGRPRFDFPAWMKHAKGINGSKASVAALEAVKAYEDHLLLSWAVDHGLGTLDPEENNHRASIEGYGDVGYEAFVADMKPLEKAEAFMADNPVFSDIFGGHARIVLSAMRTVWPDDGLSSWDLLKNTSEILRNLGNADAEETAEKAWMKDIQTTVGKQLAVNKFVLTVFGPKAAKEKGCVR